LAFKKLDTYDSSLGVPQMTRTRYTLGFLSEMSAYESESLLFKGASRAAEERDASIIYFAPITNEGEAIHQAGFPSQPYIRHKNELIKQYLSNFELDGLIIIGWCKEFEGDYSRQFQKMMHPVQLSSIGGMLPGIPSVVMNGARYVSKLTRHLIEDHSFSSIAFIPSWKEDDRLQGYSEMMLEYGLYDEKLIIRSVSLEPFSHIELRAEKALEMLIDERRLPLQAIMVMSAYEGKYMYDALVRRGLRVPEDIALVCYENHPVIDFSKPALTTIDYPYDSLGYFACKNLLDTLDGIPVPPISEVPASILFRDSCGCTVNKIKPMKSKPPLHIERSRSLELDHKALIVIDEIMRSSFKLSPFDYAIVSKAFYETASGSSQRFLSVLQEQLEGVRTWDYGQLQKLLDQLRDLLLPYVSLDSAIYERAEALWFAARYLMKDYENFSILSSYNLFTERTKSSNVISQQLLSASNVTQVTEVLKNNLGWLEIDTSYIFLNDETNVTTDTARLIHAYDRHLIITDSYSENCTFGQIYKQFAQRRSGRFSLVVMPLMVNEDYIGLLWMEPGHHTTNLVISLGEQIGKALASSLVMEQSRELVQRLSAEIVLRREKEAQLAYYANIDSLTGLFNRRFFYDSIAAFVEASKPFIVFYIDIDGFKGVNDSMGHDAGDALLLQIADRIRDVLEDAAYPLTHEVPKLGLTSLGAIFRLGGDEFTVLLRPERQQLAAGHAQRLVNALHAPFVLESRLAVVSCSIGISFYPNDASGANEMIKQADLALYKAKETKDSYVFYSDMVQNQVKRNRAEELS